MLDDNSTDNVLNQWIYIYYIMNEQLIYDRTVARYGEGPERAEQRVVQLRGLGHEAFYTIGTIPRTPALS